MAKNYGAGVSGFLDPTGYSWETTVHQASKPILDKELNLAQDLNQDRNRSIFALALSGWLNADVVNTSEHAPFFVASTVANELKVSTMTAMVNGWPILVDNTGENGSNLGSNELDMGASPAGAGSVRTDLVILEVWRRLISASPDTVGKSSAVRIWLNGNVKVNSADDVTTNLADDILDGAVGSETTKRVQIQYRLRVIQGVDLNSHPYGISDPIVFANTVPATAASPNGSASAYNFARSSTDPGLWIAGDGNPVNGLGTVDGYIYALPVLAVFRRNTTAFDRDSNQNGGVADPGPSDRPDGLFYDIFVADDVIDLRNASSPSGWDYAELLQKNLNYVFDNTLKTEHKTDALGGNVQGHTQITADEVGPTDNPGANLIREFDAVSRRFSDRANLETVVLRYTPAGANWVAGETVTIDPSSLPIYPYAPASLSSVAPSDISLIDILYVWYLDEAATAGGGLPTIAMGDIPTTDFSKRQLFITGALGGLGQVPQGSFQIQVGSSVVGISASSQALYMVALISYPKGQGLTYTPTADYGLADSVVIETPAQLPAGSPIEYSALEDFSMDPQHRELELTYRTNELTYTYTYTVQEAVASILLAPQSQDLTNRVLLAERAGTVNEIRRISAPAVTYTGGITISTDGRVLTIDDAAGNWGGNALVEGDVLEIDYEAIRPIPNNNVQMTFWYEKRAPQTLRDAICGTSLTVIPRYVAPFVVALTGGSGSQGDAYPFPTAYTQSPGVYPTSGGTFDGDHELDSIGGITIAEFNADTGFVQVPALIPAVPNPQELVFNRNLADLDAEQRTFFKEVPAGYIPSAFGQPLGDAARHKNILAMVAELATDSAMGPAGSLVLVLLSRWADFDAENKVAFDPDLAANRTSASVYRLKGNPINPRRV